MIGTFYANYPLNCNEYTLIEFLFETRMKFGDTFEIKVFLIMIREKTKVLASSDIRNEWGMGYNVRSNFGMKIFKISVICSIN